MGVPGLSHFDERLTDRSGSVGLGFPVERHLLPYVQYLRDLSPLLRRPQHARWNHDERCRAGERHEHGDPDPTATPTLTASAAPTIRSRSRWLSRLREERWWRFLVERGFAVFAINPKQLDRFRDRHTVSGAKDDRRDAFVLADSVRTDQHCFRRVRLDDPLIIQIRELSRVDEDLCQEESRLSNRLRDLLHRFFPQMVELSSPPDDAWLLELLGACAHAGESQSVASTGRREDPPEASHPAPDSRTGPPQAQDVTSPRGPRRRRGVLGTRASASASTPAGTNSASAQRSISRTCSEESAWRRQPRQRSASTVTSRSFDLFQEWEDS